MNSFKRAGVARILLLFLIVLTSWRAQTAHADGVNGSINNGQTVTGTISGKGFDTYTFKVAGDGAFFVSIAETGPHNDIFVPTITLTAPDGGVRSRGAPLFTLLKKNNAAEGQWSVKVDQSGRGTVSGGYALTLVQVPGSVPASGGIAVSPLASGTASSGSITRGKIDVWTFNGVAGHTSTLTLSKTGGEGFDPEVAVVSPTGEILGGASCDNCNQDFLLKATGIYSVVAWKADDHDVTGTYSLSMSDKK